MGALGNPDGKGAHPLMHALERHELGARRLGKLAALYEGRHTELMVRYLSTLFVLSCEFKFEPVRDHTYHIYFHERPYLSLIPGNQAGNVLGTHLGTCRLRSDNLWDVDITGKLPDDVRLSFDTEIFDKAWHLHPGLNFYANVCLHQATKTAESVVGRAALPAYTAAAKDELLKRLPAHFSEK